MDRVLGDLLAGAGMAVGPAPGGGRELVRTVAGGRVAVRTAAARVTSGAATWPGHPRREARRGPALRRRGDVRDPPVVTPGSWQVVVVRDRVEVRVRAWSGGSSPAISLLTPRVLTLLAGDDAWR